MTWRTSALGAICLPTSASQSSPETAFIRGGFVVAPSPVARGAQIEHHRGGVRAVRRRIEHLPPLADALTWLRGRVQDEQRRDVAVRVGELSMAPDGRMRRSDHADRGFWLTRSAFEQLTRLVKAPRHAGAYLATVPTTRRAAELNHILTANFPERRLVLRSRRPCSAGLSAPEIFTVVTERYTPVDPDQVAERLLRAVDQDQGLGSARAEVIYSGTRTSIRIYQNGDRELTKLGRDEAFAAVLDLRLGDDKTTGINVDIGALRSLCLNLMLVSLDRQGLLRARHVGDATGLLHQILGSVRSGAGLLPEFLTKYEAATAVRIADPGAAIRALTGLGSGSKSSAVLRITGVKPVALADRVSRAWEREGDRTQRGIANAVTRAAHTEPWPSIWSGRELERQGSLLLATPEPRFRRLIESRL